MPVFIIRNTHVWIYALLCNKKSAWIPRRPEHPALLWFLAVSLLFRCNLVPVWIMWPMFVWAPLMHLSPLGARQKSPYIFNSIRFVFSFDFSFGCFSTISNFNFNFWFFVASFYGYFRGIDILHPRYDQQYPQRKKNTRIIEEPLPYKCYSSDYCHIHIFGNDGNDGKRPPFLS